MTHHVLIDEPLDIDLRRYRDRYGLMMSRTRIDPSRCFIEALHLLGAGRVDHEPAQERVPKPAGSPR